MSTYSQSPTACPPPQYEVSDLEVHDSGNEPSKHYFWSTSVEPPRDNAHRSDLAIFPTMQIHHSVPDHTSFPLDADQVYHALSAPAQVNQESHHPALWRSVDTQVFPNVSHDRMSTPHLAYMPAQHGTHWSTHAAYDPFSTPWPNSDEGVLPRLVGQDIYIYNSGNRLLEEPNVHGRLSHVTVSRSPGTLSGGQEQNIRESFIAPYPPPPQPSGSSLTYPSSHLTSTRYLEPEPCFRLVPPQDSSAPSHHRRGACAIEYAGLWFDEEELLQGRMEHGGKLNVHQCLWEADRSPCHLWIKCDKSCIGTHLQRWHGVKPGGDKLEVECHWSACGRMMLKESIARHVLNIHVGESWTCQACGKTITRKDVYGRHVAKSSFAGCQTAGARITYSADVRTIDVHVALDSGSRLLYADK